MINEKKLELYLKEGQNVLLEGAHGVGKTAVIKKVFESAGLKWKYFSASTMDPWVDFIGVPKSIVDDNGVEILELVKPKDFAYDDVEAIFFDEFNRAPSKVMNAVMELIQFKSINGKKFNNLKVVWAAVNPFDEDGTYSVNKIDPATEDRFQIKISVPYELDVGYLIKTHGAIAKPFIKWWQELPKELQMKISPRRVDYAINIYSIGGDLRDVLLKESNVQKLNQLISEDKDLLLFDELLKKSPDEIKKFFTLENTMKWAEKIIKEPFANELMPYFNQEFIEQSIQTKDNGGKIKKFFVEKALEDENFNKKLSKNSQEIIKEISIKKSHVINYQMSSNMSGLINSTALTSLKYSQKTIVTRLYPVFLKYLKEIAKNKNTDLPTFFEAALNPETNDGVNYCDDMLKALSTGFKNMSMSMPDEKMFLFMGMLYNFALKIAKETQSKHEKAIKTFVERVFETSYKTRENANRSAEDFIYGFNEKNWNIFKQSLEEKKVIKSFNEYKEFAKAHNKGDKSVFVIDPVLSMDAAKEIFCKTNLDNVLNQELSVKARKKGI